MFVRESWFRRVIPLSAKNKIYFFSFRFLYEKILTLFPNNIKKKRRCTLLFARFMVRQFG